jgi:peptidoglycan biosynthesis protein MviN/MurJ (putative lipid II flippase)
MIYSIVAAVVNIVVSVLLVQRIGVTGAILGTIIAYAVCVLVPQWIEVERFLNTVHSTPQYEKSGLAESPIRSHSEPEGVQGTSR